MVDITQVLQTLSRDERINLVRTSYDGRINDFNEVQNASDQAHWAAIVSTLALNSSTVVQALSDDKLVAYGVADTASDALKKLGSIGLLYSAFSSNDPKTALWSSSAGWLAGEMLYLAK